MFFVFQCFYLCVISLLGFADCSFVPPLIYSVLGSSRDLAVGPVSIASRRFDVTDSHCGLALLNIKNKFSRVFVLSNLSYMLQL